MNVRQFAPWGLLVFAATGPFWYIQSAFALSLLTTTLIFMATSLAWNIVGFTGLLSFGHSAFFGLGAYTSVLLYIHFDLSPWIGMLPAAFVAVVAALIIGVPSFRLRGIYFTLVTFTVTLILAILAGHFRVLTGGQVGLSVPFQRNNPSAMQFENKVWFFYIALVLVALCFVIAVLIRRSRLGYALRAIRDDETAAEASGVKVLRSKLVALIVSAILTALAGVVYAQFILFIDPTGMFGLATAALIALPAIAGGLGTIWGPVLGALVLVPLEQALNDQFSSAIPGLSQIVYAAILIIIVLLDPGGLLSLIKRMTQWFRALLKLSSSPRAREAAK